MGGVMTLRQRIEPELPCPHCGALGIDQRLRFLFGPLLWWCDPTHGWVYTDEQVRDFA